MRPVIFYRDFDIRQFQGELEAASSNFKTISQRTNVEENDLVICRYSALPLYKELERDIVNLGGTMINSYSQHRYVADLKNWYYDLEDLTFKTWFQASDVPANHPGSFILKGETNSKKFQWNTHMFAKDYSGISPVLVNLMNDGLVGSQSIYVREYVPLKTYMESFQGMRITDEYRFFIAYGEIISGAYYWSSHIEELSEAGFCPNANDVPSDFLNDVISRVGDSINFWVLDVAQTEDGIWKVVELNDGQMSGLSENKPTELYCNLRQSIKNRFAV